MSSQRQPASALLPVLADVFPRTFFADPKQVRPLKINIHRDLNDWRQAQALPAAISLIPLRRFLHWYTKRTAYLKALARGLGRLDLTGAVVARRRFLMPFASRPARRCNADRQTVPPRPPRPRRLLQRPCPRQSRPPFRIPWRTCTPWPSMPSWK